MKVQVDYGRCEGHSVCIGLAPDAFDMGDDDEQVRVVSDRSDKEFRRAVEAAARQCPTMAIKIED